jgi:hypothetical protein
MDTAIYKHVVHHLHVSAIFREVFNKEKHSPTNALFIELGKV